VRTRAACAIVPRDAAKRPGFARGGERAGQIDMVKTLEVGRLFVQVCHFLISSWNVRKYVKM
jgi:hypothetical protein